MAPYKISGTTDAARIIIIKESDWSIENNSTESAGSYEVLDLENNAKLIIARKSDGETLAFGNVSPIYYTPPARGIIGGGWDGINLIEYITISSASNSQDFGDLTLARWGTAATSNGSNDRGIFAGGNAINVMDYVTISTTGNAQDFGDLTLDRRNMGACSNGTNNRGVWGGGYRGAAYDKNVIDYVTISSAGNAQDFGDLAGNSTGNVGVCGTDNATGGRGIFAGGATNYAIDYITISSTGNSSAFGWLNGTTGYLAGAASNGTNNRGLIGGGTSGTNVIDYITITTTGDAQDFGDLTRSDYQLTATDNGTSDRAVWCGGVATNVIDYVTISTTGNAADFGDLLDGREHLAATSNA